MDLLEGGFLQRIYLREAFYKGSIGGMFSKQDLLEGGLSHWIYWRDVFYTRFI